MLFQPPPWKAVFLALLFSPQKLRHVAGKAGLGVRSPSFRFKVLSNDCWETRCDSYHMTVFQGGITECGQREARGGWTRRVLPQ